MICFVFFTIVELIRHRFDFDYLDFEAQLDYIIPLSLSISIVLGVIISADRQVKKWDVEDLKYEPVVQEEVKQDSVPKEKIKNIEEPREQAESQIFKKEKLVISRNNQERSESKIMLYLTSLLIWALIFFSIFGILTLIFMHKEDVFTLKKIRVFHPWAMPVLLLVSLIISLPIWFYSPYAPDDIKLLIKADYRRISKIQTKINELADLAKKLDKKYKEINSLISDYQKGINTLKQEIRIEKEKNKILNLAKAQKNPLIARNLSLIQRKQAYINKLVKTAGQLKIAILDIQFLQRQVEDDLKIVKVLKSEDAKKILKQINQVMEKYLPQAGEMPVIKIDEKTLPSLEQIWQDIE